MTRFHTFITSLAAVIALQFAGGTAAAQTPSSMSGTWNVSLIGDHVIPMALTLEQHGAALSGTLSIMGKDVPVSGEVTGREFTLKGKASVMLHGAANDSSAATPLSMHGTVTDDGTLAGDFAAATGALKWTAERLRARGTNAAKTKPAANASVIGSWSMTMALQPEPMSAALELVQKGAEVAGTLVNEHLGTLRVSGKVTDGSVVFVAEGEAHGQAVRIEYAGKILPDGSMAGELSSQVGNTTWSATRVKK